MTATDQRASRCVPLVSLLPVPQTSSFSHIHPTVITNGSLHPSGL